MARLWVKRSLADKGRGVLGVHSRRWVVGGKAGPLKELPDKAWLPLLWAPSCDCPLLRPTEPTSAPPAPQQVPPCGRGTNGLHTAPTRCGGRTRPSPEV